MMMRRGRSALDEFAARETNRALRSDGAIELARALTEAAGLPQHGDRPKAWDNLLAVYWADKLCEDADARILDAGAGDESAFLPAMARHGFRNLVACNTDKEIFRGSDDAASVAYWRADITDMPWDDGEFDFIACLSVIEHGVDVPKFLSEAARVLKPGGHLFISTDYWQDPIDCGGRMAFGAPVRIFDWGAIGRLEMEARVLGLIPTGLIDYRCEDHTVQWIGLEYTFINLLLRKAA